MIRNWLSGTMCALQNPERRGEFRQKLVAYYRALGTVYSERSDAPRGDVAGWSDGVLLEVAGVDGDGACGGWTLVGRD